MLPRLRQQLELIGEEPEGPHRDGKDSGHPHDEPRFKGVEAMATVRVFDPAMCCSTGVCGPSVDPVLVRFAADVEWLKSKGVKVERVNLSQQPQAFVSNPVVRSLLEKEGTECLPLILIDDQVAFKGGYPTRAEMAERLGLDASDDLDLLPMAKPGRNCCPGGNCC